MTKDEEKSKEKDELSEESSFFTDDPMARFEKKNSKKTTKSGKSGDSEKSGDIQDKKSEGGSKKKIIAIIAGLLVVGVLAGAVALVNVTGVGKKADTEATTEMPTGEFSILGTQSSDSVKTIEIKSPDTEYTVVRTKKAKGDDKTEYTIKGYEKYGLDKDMLSTLSSNAIGLTSYQTVEKGAADLEKYGLGKDATVVTLNFDDGTKEKFRVGKDTADTGYEYFCEDSSTDVYTVENSKVNNYKNKPENFISKVMIENPSDTNVYVKSLDLSRLDLGYDISLKYSKRVKKELTDSKSAQSAQGSNSRPVYLEMTSPVKADLNSANSEKAVNGLFGLTAMGIEKLSPSAEDLKKYKLDKPCAQVNVTLSNKKKITLEIGDSYANQEAEDLAKVGGVVDSTDASSAPSAMLYYCRTSENPDIVYIVGSNSLPWATMKPIDITNKSILNVYVFDVGKMTVEADGKKLSFIGSGEDKDTYVVSCNSKTCETERYRQFYAFLVRASGEEIAVEQKAEGKPMLSVKLETQDGETKKNVKFYDAGGLKCLVTVDDKPTFLCRKSFVKAVAYNVSVFDSKKEFKTSWE